MAERDRLKWNAKYQDKVQGDAPAANDTLRSLSSYLVGGMCLDVACGLGGNSLYLAKHGYQVISLDVSDVAVSYLQQKAKQDNLPITASQVDLDKASLPPELYDLVVVTYFLDRQLYKSLKSVVKEGGFIFFETFYEAAGTNEHMNSRFKLKPFELQDLFREWKIFQFIQDEQKGIQSVFAQKRSADLESN